MFKLGIMKFDDFDKQMRVYETTNDYSVMPGVYMVARIDGRGFTKLTKEKHSFETPFDIRFRDYMIATVEHLMNCGFKIIYGYTQSDEISLLFDFNDNGFGRKLRKLNSILAGEASAKFSVQLQDVAAFDCRISQLPSKKEVVDYFRWRSEDAFRNSLSAHCYWLLRSKGKDYKTATTTIEGMSTSLKNELLFQNGINFNDLPAWQKRGVGLYWQNVKKEGVNPLTKQKTMTERKTLITSTELPLKEAYSNMIMQLMN